MELVNARSLRRAYLDWVEDQIEAYKESIPRADLLHLADQVVEEQRVTQAGQYQLSEMILCDAVNRKIFRMLKLPGYRAWANALRARVEADGVTLLRRPDPCQSDALADPPETHTDSSSVGVREVKRFVAMV